MRITEAARERVEDRERVCAAAAVDGRRRRDVCL